MWQLLSPTALLLLVSAGTHAEDPPKSVVILDPPWDRLLEKDSVTLKCQGAYPPGDDSTEWRWNGTLISNKASSYSITDATVGNSGEYTCKTGLSAQSDPLRLEVYKGSKSPSPILSFFLPWHQIIFCLVMGFLFAVDTGLYFSVRKVLRSSKEDWRNGKVTWSRDPQDKGG
uniref:Low affinity immunoglobulin gamma Fc region receptor III-A n=1 Tax=Sus scrofa TaxID=9823 RepID=Q95N20_PIG|nr:FcgammaRIII a.3 [Sus scrofa]